MIALKEDSEFMKNLLPANPVPAGKRFVAIKDSALRPALVALSQDEKLNLIITKNGTPTLVDYGHLCGLEGAVVAFDVYQDSDLSLWFVVATDAGSSKSRLYILANVLIEDVLSPRPETIIHAGDSFSTVHGVYISNFLQSVGRYQIPLIFLALQPPDRITAEDQLAFLDITFDANEKLRVSLNTSWKLATNPLMILDIAFGSAIVGNGAFVLYRSTNGLHLQFKVFGGHDFSVEVTVPAGATCITSYMDDTTNSSVLIVGGEQITAFTAKQWVRPWAKGSTIVASNVALNLKDIHHSKTTKNLSLWFTTTDNAVQYYSTDLDRLDDGLLVPLLPQGRGGQISGLLTSPSVHEDILVHTLLSVNETGFLTMLQQSATTGLWEAIPFYTPSDTENMEIPSYTIRIAASADGSNASEAVENCELRLVSTDMVPIHVNGITEVLSPQGKWFTCDANGILTLIVATQDLACVTIKVNDYRSANDLDLKLPELIINPMKQTTKKLSNISTADDILNARTQTGELLVPKDSVSREDATNAAKAVSHLTSTEPNSLMATINPFQRQQRQVKFTDAMRLERPVHLAGALPETSDQLEEMFTMGAFSDAWDFFHRLWEGVKEIVFWSLQKIGNAVHLVLQWAGKTFRFVLDTIQAIGKAISWVFKKIMVAVKKLIEFIGFLFKWDDILTTADSINAYLNAGLSHGYDQIDGLKAKVDNAVQQLKRKVLDEKLKPDNTPTASNQQDSKATEKTSSIHKSAAYNFGHYHMQHSGFANKSTVIRNESTVKASGKQDDLKKIWDGMKREAGTVQDLVKNIAHDIRDLFTPDTNTDKIWSRLKDHMITAALDTLQNVADILLSALALVISELQDFGNAEIKVPIFGALWKLITKGRKFTLFNCLSLILAIPTTILYKLGTNAAPPALEGRISADTFGKFVNNDPGLDRTLYRDMLALSQCMIATAGGVGIVVTVISFATDRLMKGHSLKGEPQDGHMDEDEDAIFAGQKAGNAIDGAIMFFDVIGLILTWPGRHKHDKELRSYVWGLDLSNAVCLALSRIIGYDMGYPRVQTKRVVGVWEAVSSIPTYILQMIINVRELKLPDDDPDKDNDLAARHIVEDTATLISSWAFGVAALADEVQDEVTVIALSVMGLALAVKFAMKFVDFVLWYGKPSGPGLVEPPEGQMPLLGDDDAPTGEEEEGQKKKNVVQEEKASTFDAD